MKLSIIVPVLNESGSIEAFARNFSLNCSDYEVILADGGSGDDTVEKGERLGFNVVKNIRTGRAFQMNEGALAAKGEILFFLHADSILPFGWYRMILDALEEEGVSACCFDIKFNTSKKGMELIARAANKRSRVTSVPYGDQGLALKAATFKKLGGFPEVSFLEDIQLSMKVKKTGRIAFLNSPLITSARRWEKKGIIKVTFENWLIVLLFFLGFKPDVLKKFFYK